MNDAPPNENTGFPWFDELLRLPTAYLVAYYTFWKCLGLGAILTLLGGFFCVVVLLPPSVCERIQNEFEHRTRLQKFFFVVFAPKRKLAELPVPIRWMTRALFCLAMTVFSALPMNDAERPDFTEVLWETEGLECYDAKLTPNGKYLLVTHAHSPKNGLSRFNLENGTAEHISLNDVHPHYVELFHDDNTALVTSRSDEEQLATLYKFSIEPFELKSHQRCDGIYPIRTPKYGRDRFLLLQKGFDRNQGLYVSDDLKAPCARAKRVLDIPGTVIAAETLAFLPGEPDRLWVQGEGGGEICLVDLAKSEIDRCVWAGLGVWSTVMAPDADEMWHSRQLSHRLDVRNNHTGELLKSIAVNGTPRPIVFDPNGKFAYAGMYWDGHIAVVDIESSSVKSYVRSGRRVRALLIDHVRHKLIAVSAEGVFLFPLAYLRAHH